jgi:hypothetical protein
VGSGELVEPAGKAEIIGVSQSGIVQNISPTNATLTRLAKQFPSLELTVRYRP